MFTILNYIKKYLIIFIFFSIGFGVLFGGLYPEQIANLKVTIIPLTFMLVYPMMVTLNFKSMTQKINFKLQGATQVINFIIFPLIGYLIGLVFFGQEPFLRLGLLLIALLPTSGMTISWTVMAKGNINAAIRMVVIGLLLGAILAPFYISGLLGAAVDVPVLEIIKQILIVVFVPLGLAIITQYVLVKKYGNEVFQTSIKKKFPPFSTLGVVLIIFVAISLKAQVIIKNPEILITMLVPLVIMYILFIAVSVLTARFFFDRNDGIALVNGTLIRSLSLALAITLSAFPDAKLTALMIAIAYTLQVQIAAWNVKLTDKIFKEKDVA
jgi:ACR3 family arsenite efflux pump ArsB